MVLVVEDEPEIAEILEGYLRRDGYRTERAADGKAALGLYRAAKPDLVLLDIQLPELDGLEVLRRIRADGNTPVILVTACSEDLDKLLGLELGADDYVTKPFSPREVVARVRALLRRSGLKAELAFGELVIRPREREAYLAGEPLALSKLEFDLLLTLAQHPRLVWSRERLLERVWGTDFPGVDRVVDVHIAGLRKKLGEDGDNPRYIETVRGVGYRFQEE